jgi:hypothetical protein
MATERTKYKLFRHEDGNPYHLMLVGRFVSLGDAKIAQLAYSETMVGMTHYVTNNKDVVVRSCSPQ